MKIRFGECEACAVRSEEIKHLQESHIKEVDYLKETVERLAREKEVERAEYKRSIDAILILMKAPAIGQGSDEHKKPLDMNQLLGYMVEPGEDQMETRHPDTLTNKVDE